jgi:hypothetical protein
MIEDIRVGARFLAQLPGFLRSPVSLAEARRRVERRLRTRSELLLALLDVIDAGPADAPYARLMSACGCTAQDARQLVLEEGVEGALGRLLDAGVFFTCDEFKGRVPVVRGSETFTVDPARLRNPRANVHGLAQTGGSRGVPTPVPIDLAFIEDHAVNTHLTLEAHGGHSWAHAHYGVPGGTAVTNPLEFAKGGNPPERWFTPVDPATPGLHARYRLGSMALWLGSRLAGVPLPGPTYAPLDSPEPIVSWLAEVLAQGRTPHVWTFASSAVLVCETAAALGVDIAGARFTAGGEPTTPARRRAVEGVGAVMIPRMGATETDILAYACVDPDAADDMHFFHDRHALVQPDGDNTAPALPEKAMVLTSLLPTAPIFLLNVCLGDQATVVRRECGCAMADIGWTYHVSEVRSYQKLTAGGITLLDSDIIHVLEHVLPGRFGGTHLDYQLVERVDMDTGHAVVQLLVAPHLADVVESDVRDMFLTAIGGGTGGQHLMALQWRHGSVLRVIREQPRRTASGKIQHVHVEAG